MHPRRSLVAIALFSLAACSLAGAKEDKLPRPEDALPGRATPMELPARHLIFNTPLDITPEGMEVAFFSMGCFWGAEQYFFKVPGVVSTAAGYMGGTTPNPTYDEVSSGRTGHAETVRVVYNPKLVSYERLLRVFWENHDPTQGMRQGNDTGTQYRSEIFTTTEVQRRAALESRDVYMAALHAAGKGDITTDIRMAPVFYYAEGYHQQYCAANPQGYCAHGGTGILFPH